MIKMTMLVKCDVCKTTKEVKLTDRYKSFKGACSNKECRSGAIKIKAA